MFPPCVAQMLEVEGLRDGLLPDVTLILYAY